LGEYGTEYEEDAFEELSEEKDENMSGGKSLDIDDEFDKQLDKNWDLEEKDEDPFDEFIYKEPTEENDDPCNEFKDREPEKDVKEEFSISDIADEISYKNQSEKNKEALLNGILNGNISKIQNFKENLKENLYKNIKIELNEKSKIVKLIQNESLTKENKDELKLILSRFSTKEINEYLNINIKKPSTFCEEIEEYEENHYDLKDFTDDIDSKYVNEDFLEKLDEETDCDITRDFIKEIKLNEDDYNFHIDTKEKKTDELDDFEIENALIEEKEEKNIENDLQKDSLKDLKEHLNESFFKNNFKNEKMVKDDFFQDYQELMNNHNIVRKNEIENETRLENIEIEEISNNKKIEIKNIDIQKMREQIRNINWDNISKDWTVIHRTNQYSDSEIIQLDPKQACSKNNPLYRHKEWLEHTYNDKKLNLNDKKIGEICGVDKSTIGKWRKVHEIPTKPKGHGKWIDNRDGRIKVLMPKDYKHPELKCSRSDGRYIRPEHVTIMEQYLSKHPELYISKKYLIDRNYLKTGCEVHHINFNSKDNRIENLWLYHNKREHAQGELTLGDSLLYLIKTNQIRFKDGRYSLTQNFDNSKPKLTEPELNQHKDTYINYKDINLVKEEIIKIDWQVVSKDWTVQIKKNQFAKETVSVNPTKDCSEDNPLYRHKEWVQQLFNDKRFNLTDSRLAKLCGISRDKARYWRDRVHKIRGNSEWGFESIVDKNDGRIWVKVPKDYKNPVVQKEDHHRRYMLEHRYVMEQYSQSIQS